MTPYTNARVLIVGYMLDAASDVERAALGRACPLSGCSPDEAYAYADVDEYEYVDDATEYAGEMMELAIAARVQRVRALEALLRWGLS